MRIFGISLIVANSYLTFFCSTLPPGSPSASAAFLLPGGAFVYHRTSNETSSGGLFIQIGTSDFIDHPLFSCAVTPSGTMRWTCHEPVTLDKNTVYWIRLNDPVRAQTRPTSSDFGDEFFVLGQQTVRSSFVSMSGQSNLQFAVSTFQIVDDSGTIR